MSEEFLHYNDGTIRSVPINAHDMCCEQVSHCNMECSAVTAMGTFCSGRGFTTLACASSLSKHMNVGHRCSLAGRFFLNLFPIYTCIHVYTERKGIHLGSQLT